jgi:translocation and assembly module TamB
MGSGAGNISRWFRRLLYATGALAVLAALLLGVVSTAWFQRGVERRVVAELEDLSGGRVELREFRLQPAILQATFRGLILHGKRLAGESPLLSAKTVTLRLDPVSLLRRKLVLRSLDCEEAEVHFYTRADGSTNFRSPLVPLGAGAQAQLSIGQLTLARTHFFWNNQHLPIDLSAQDVAILLRLDPSQHYLGNLSSSGVVIKTREQVLPPMAVQAAFELSAERLEVSSLAWQSAHLSGEGTFSLANWASPEGQLSFQARGEVAELAQALKLREIRNGNIELDGQASYHRGEFRAKGRIRARRLSFQSSAFRASGIDLSTDYSAEPRHLELSNLTVLALGGTTQGRAEISFRDSLPRVVLRAQLRGLRLDAALRSLSRPPAILDRLRLASQVSGTLDAAWDGRLENLNSQFNLQMQPPPASPFDGPPLRGFVRGSASTARGMVLEIHDAELQTPHSTLTAHGSWGRQQAGLTLRFVTTDFEEWRPAVEFLTGSPDYIPLKLNSEATFTGEVAGSVDRPEVRGRFIAGPLDYHGWTWGSLRGDVLAAPDRLEVSSARLRLDESTLALAGAVSLENWRVAPEAPARLTVRLEHTRIEGLKAALGINFPAGGFATARLDVAGTPANLSGTGEVRVDRGALAGEPFDSLSARLRVAESVFYFEDAQLAKGQGRLWGQARVNPSQRSFAVDLHGADFSLAEFKRLTPLFAANAAQSVSGQVGFDLRGQGTPDDVTLLATWKARNVALNGTPFGELDGKIDWQGLEMRLEGRCQGPAGTWWFSGVARSEGDWPLELSGQYADLRADTWVRVWLEKKFNARVIASGTFTARGPLRDPGQLEAWGQAQNLEVGLPNLTWKNDQPVAFHYANRTLTANRFRIRGPSTDLEVEGSLQFSQPAALSLTAQGKADAALLSLIDPAVQAAGPSEVKLRVSGSLAHPLLYGALDVQDASLGYGDLPVRLTELKGAIALEGERATIRSLRGTSGGGAVTLGGFLTFAHPPRFNLEAQLTQVRVRYPPEFSSVLDGSLRLVGTAESAQLGGELTVRQIFAREDFNWLARLGKAGVAVEAKPAAVASPLASNLRLNVQVVSAPAVRFETRDLRLVADIDLRLTGTLANPVQLGTIHVTSGEAVFRGNRYTLNRGNISMTNPFRTQLVVDLEAQTRLQRYDLTVDLSGPLDRLKVAYRSDPPLPTADIISLLALGFARQQEEMATTTARPVPTLGASALLSEALSTQVSGRIQRLFGVSRIKIDPNVGGLGSTGGTRVTVEQQVTRDLTLTYVTTATSSQQRIIQFEWAVSDRISLVGARDQNGILGMELKVRQRFK